MVMCSQWIKVSTLTMHVVQPTPKAITCQDDFLVNFPGPVNNKSSTNADIIFYLCQELVDVWGPWISVIRKKSLPRSPEGSSPETSVACPKPCASLRPPPINGAPKTSQPSGRGMNPNDRHPEDTTFCRTFIQLTESQPSQESEPLPRRASWDCMKLGF